MIKEFREFIMKGNVMDMAVGIILGVAFGNIVNSLVKDVLMPPIGLALGKVDFSNLFVNLGGGSFASLADAEKAGAPVIKYGLFINNVINFLIIAFIVFLIVKAVNKLRREQVTTKDCPFCASTIALGAKKCPQCTSELPAA